MARCELAIKMKNEGKMSFTMGVGLVFSEKTSHWDQFYIMDNRYDVKKRHDTPITPYFQMAYDEDDVI